MGYASRKPKHSYRPDTTGLLPGVARGNAATSDSELLQADDGRVEVADCCIAGEIKAGRPVWSGLACKQPVVGERDVGCRHGLRQIGGAEIRREPRGEFVRWEERQTH